MSKKKFDRKFFNFTVPLTVQESDGFDFDGLAYSGEVIPRHYIFENLFIDLDSLNAKSQIPIFRDHSPSQIAGHGTLYKDADNQLKVKGRIYQNSHGSEIAEIAKEGFNWELSIGAVPTYLEEIPKGKEMTVNGVTSDEGMVIFRDTRIIEVSFVAIGADSNTSAEVFSFNADELSEEETITVEVRDMENKDIKPVEQITEQTEQSVDAPETQTEQTAELSATEVALQATIDKLTAELACSCSEKKEAKSDLEKAEDTIKALEAEIKELKSSKKKEDFAIKAKELGLNLSDDQVEFFHAELSEEDKFDKVLDILSQQAKLAKPELPAELMQKQTMETVFSSVSGDSDSKEIYSKAKQLIKAAKEEGRSLDMVSAVSQLTNR